VAVLSLLRCRVVWLQYTRVTCWLRSCQTLVVLLVAQKGQHVHMCVYVRFFCSDLVTPVSSNKQAVVCVIFLTSSVSSPGQTLVVVRGCAGCG
jgi:hypothetical protein